MTDQGGPRPFALIVDDSLTVRMDLVETLGAAGFEALACGTAAEARAMAAERTPDLVVLDVLLPDGDGVGVLRDLKDDPATAQVPVILLSTEGEVADRVRGLRTGADDYVGKPYDPGQLVARARQLARQSRGGRAVPLALVIDDSATLRAELGEALRGAGYEVVAAATGEEGLRAAAQVRPDVVVVDGVLPGMDGAAVLRQLRLDPGLRRTPCLMLTGSSDAREELRALDAGADTFLKKDEGVAVVLARIGALRRASAGPVIEAPSLHGPKRVLAVDDSVTYLDYVRTALVGEGYEVVAARSGEEALELLAVQPVDCILLDLMMPGLSGHDTCRAIKGSGRLRDIPLIMLTAREDRESMIQGIDAGADDYIAKSSDLEVLKARLRAQLRRKQFEDENRRMREQMNVELEARVADRTRQLELANRELEAFAYSVSHDLRAPLRSIAGFSEVLLADYAGALPPDGLDCLRRVRAAAHRMGDLIDALLGLARVSRAELRRAPVDLSEMARAIAAELQGAAPERRASFTIRPDLRAEGDPRLLRVLLENLLGNAWKYTGPRDPAVIEFTSIATENGPAFCVRDNGVGFDMAYVDRLFAPFQRLHGAGEFAGSGIGLATVLRITARHGGCVWATAAPDLGAAFFFTIAS